MRQMHIATWDPHSHLDRRTAVLRLHLCFKLPSLSCCSLTHRPLDILIILEMHPSRIIACSQAQDFSSLDVFRAKSLGIQGKSCIRECFLQRREAKALACSKSPALREVHKEQHLRAEAGM